MNNLRIARLEEVEGEDILGNVINLAKKMKIQLKPTDIKDVRRMGPKKNNKIRDILVKFTSTEVRDSLYQNRKLLVHEAEPVFVNEDLTQRRSQLFYEARKLRKKARLFGTWSQQGNILVKVNQQSQPRQVANYTEIIALIEEQANKIQTTRDLEVGAESLEDNDL